MEIILNGETRRMEENLTLADLVAELQLSGVRIAVERNAAIVPHGEYAKCALRDGDRLEIVRAIGGGQEDTFTIAGRVFHSRLLVGTGKYKDLEETRRAVEASGAEIITVAIRRSNIGQDPSQPNLLDVLPPERYTLLPNTAGCYTVEDAVRTCRLARELLDGHKLVKLEVLGDPKTLFPDVIGTLEAAKILVAEGFDVMVYTNDDPITAKRLEDLGCVAVMPLAAPIGSGLGIRNPYNLLTILENASVPVLVDAGVGTASDAAIAMELGCGGVLMNTAIAEAKNPVLMASAMKKAIEAGREAFLAGRMPRKRYASASSPVDGLFF
ncbi:sulfur carrier protein ThiS [Methylococcus sp. EFPC2]|uniref:sulfur carrier protein ThiS n=1 Tax=Methylococcus sp. EFPC2 TaxID=2812648 RepID=UPI001967ABF9|nr:sulfur carrier protein ThiS [Methylococcus sp. EFPC2]QSA96636.1 sulfur carrier protein ThiS [Methylococcus sp. EFPC2]